MAHLTPLALGSTCPVSAPDRPTIVHLASSVCSFLFTLKTSFCWCTARDHLTLVALAPLQLCAAGRGSQHWQGVGSGRACSGKDLCRLHHHVRRVTTNVMVTADSCRTWCQLSGPDVRRQRLEVVPSTASTHSAVFLIHPEAAQL